MSLAGKTVRGRYKDLKHFLNGRVYRFEDDPKFCWNLHYMQTMPAPTNVPTFTFPETSDGEARLDVQAQSVGHDTPV